ncbi:hypothetical protein EGW08_012379 [Elysia chlorotica]|uniref:BHLH domain-containing protein n=1 Tax=Elysia chlorotica TaxID=188477 RepID=A0A3S1B4Q9_ELYCH|nr:hypothetical protein EGW08_012379 [Elysia chlorotica]
MEDYTLERQPEVEESSAEPGPSQMSPRSREVGGPDHDFRRPATRDKRAGVPKKLVGLSEEELERKRLRNNELERHRQQALQTAFRRLDQAVPDFIKVSKHKESSKMSTLENAMFYMKHLAKQIYSDDVYQFGSAEYKQESVTNVSPERGLAVVVRNNGYSGRPYQAHLDNNGLQTVPLSLASGDEPRMGENMSNANNPHMNHNTRIINCVYQQINYNLCNGGNQFFKYNHINNSEQQMNHSPSNCRYQRINGIVSNSCCYQPRNANLDNVAPYQTNHEVVYGVNQHMNRNHSNVADRSLNRDLRSQGSQNVNPSYHNTNQNLDNTSTLVGNNATPGSCKRMCLNKENVSSHFPSPEGGLESNSRSVLQRQSTQSPATVRATPPNVDHPQFTQNIISQSLSPLQQRSCSHTNRMRFRQCPQNHPSNLSTPFFEYQYPGYTSLRQGPHSQNPAPNYSARVPSNRSSGHANLGQLPNHPTPLSNGYYSQPMNLRQSPLPLNLVTKYSTHLSDTQHHEDTSRHSFYADTTCLTPPIPDASCLMSPMHVSNFSGSDHDRGNATADGTVFDEFTRNLPCSSPDCLEYSAPYSETPSRSFSLSRCQDSGYGTVSDASLDDFMQSLPSISPYKASRTLDDGGEDTPRHKVPVQKRKLDFDKAP